MVPVIVIIMLSIMATNAGLNQLCELIDFYDKLGICLECLVIMVVGVATRGRCNPYLNQYTFKNGTCCK